MLSQVPTSDDNEREQSKSIQRKRVLPPWMLEGGLPDQRISEPAVEGGRLAVQRVCVYVLCLLFFSCNGRRWYKGLICYFSVRALCLAAARG